MNFEEKNPQKVYFLIVPSMGETKELVILPLVSDLATIILRLAEPGEKRCYRNRNTSFSAEICWSNLVKYP